MLPTRQDTVRGFALVACAVTCLATSAPPPRPPRPFLAWQLQAADARFGCLAAHAWVAKSGREGVGVTLRLENVSEVACEVAVTGATFSVAGGHVGAVAPPTLVDERGAAAPGPLAPHTARYVYVGFAFDNAAAAAARLGGRFAATFTVDALTASLTADAHQGAYQAPGPHGRW